MISKYMHFNYKLSRSMSGAILLGLGAMLTGCKKEGPAPLPEIHEEAVLDESVSAVIPHIYINIQGGSEVVSKEDYLNATVEIKGMDQYPDLQALPTRIKGRGNSTWGKPKNPYKLKLDDAASVLGLPSAREWVLLANYQDYTLMTNAVAFKVAAQLGLPHTGTIIPVDLTINGVYRGNYNLTQQTEAGENRVNIGAGGVLLELDTHFDEEFRFISPGFALPVMVKDPDMESDAEMEKVKSDFISLEEALMAGDFPNNDYGRLLDKTQLVRYLIVNNLTGNYEINHPKSVYMHKTGSGKYIMGPVWDFDWAFGIEEQTRSYFHFPDLPLLKEGDQRKGAVFLSHFLKDPQVRALYKKEWTDYRSGRFEELMAYIEQYAARIRNSQKEDFKLWGIGDNDLPQAKADMKTYLRKRARMIDAYVAGF